MPTPNNPFPGLNPYFQELWTDVHTKMIGYISDALSEKLPDDLSARAEERVNLMGEEKPRHFRADIAITESWRAGFPPVWDSAEAETGGVAVAEPLVFEMEEVTERWLEIRDRHGELVTVIEVISPGNKVLEGKRNYCKRQQTFLAAGVNLVEIDLIRGGSPVVAMDYDQLSFPPGTCHIICVSRVTWAGTPRREIYFCPLRQPLPAIRVPLRPHDPDVALAIQPLIDRCYRTGRYWLVDQTHELSPPVAPEDRAWVAERVQAAGLAQSAT